MEISLLSLVSKNLPQQFLFLHEYGYALSKSEALTEEEFKLTYLNKETRKEIWISLRNSANTQRFFIYIAIIKIPHEVVHDFIDFDIFLNKNNIQHPDLLEGHQRTFENANKYIESYADLFKKHGIELIISDKQFPHYFPEWT